MVRRNAKGMPIELVKYHLQHWEVLPILGIVTGMCGIYAFISVYMVYSRPDVAWYRGQTTQFVRDLTNPKVNKLLKYNEVFPPKPELAQLYREMEKKEKERSK